jgi:thiol:disulfide interchange protein DsbC
LIEGTLLKVPSIKFSEKELQLLKGKALFEVGKGKEELIVLTNPVCKVCLNHREELRKLEMRYKLFVVPMGFNGEEFKAAVDAYCRKKGPEDFFKSEKVFKLCNEGKLRVWSLQALLKRKGIGGTPVFIREDGTPLFGISALKELLSQN